MRYKDRKIPQCKGELTFTTVGIESMSGMRHGSRSKLDNSDKPAQLNTCLCCKAARVGSTIQISKLSPSAAMTSVSKSERMSSGEEALQLGKGALSDAQTVEHSSKSEGLSRRRLYDSAAPSKASDGDLPSQTLNEVAHFASELCYRSFVSLISINIQLCHILRVSAAHCFNGAH